MKLFKIKYDNVKRGDTWVAHILADSREDAESLLKNRIQFDYTITSAEELGKVDAISDACLRQIISANDFLVRQIHKEKDAEKKLQRQLKQNADMRHA